MQISFSNVASIPFLGQKVWLLDSGKHAEDLVRLSHALRGDDIEYKKVPVKHIDGAIPCKDMKDLYEKLKNINSLPEGKKPEYVAIPALMEIYLTTLNWCVNETISPYMKITPENIKDYKPIILALLKDIEERPERYEEYLPHMDCEDQGIKYTHRVIEEINKAVESGVKVYLPSGVEDDNIKWMCREEGIMPALYNYISTGVDLDGSVGRVIDRMKNENEYIFNLLNLSEAENVSMQKADGSLHLFSGYDSCVNRYARGVYNYLPLHKDGKVEGYSYFDDGKVHSRDLRPETKYIEKFVGFRAEDLIASDIEHVKFRNIKDKKEEDLTPEEKEFLESVSDKLFRVSKIYSKKEIDKEKLYLQGDYVDVLQKHFFRENDEGLIFYPKLDVEGSGRPSVCNMQGPCLAIIQALSDDIEQ